MPSSAASVSLSARSARWRGWRRSRSTRSRPADDDARLRPAQKLVPREADEAGARREALARLRLVAERHERAGAEVVDEREVMCRGDRGQLGQRRAVGEAEHAEVRLVHAEQEGGLRAGGPLVVRGARSVRRPHLDEPSARAREHVGDAEAVADLDQLAAGHEHLASFRERGQRQEHGSRVVVDDERRLGACQPAQDLRDVILA